MLKKITFSPLITFFLLTLGLAANAAPEPTVHEIYLAAQAGHMAQAEAMIDEVLRAHPDSAKAHFVKSEILAREGKLAVARTELSNAERLQPDLSFTEPAALKSLKLRLSAPSMAAPAHRVTTNSFPWGMLIVGVGVVLFVIFVVRNLLGQRQAYQASPSPFGNAPVSGYPGQPYGPTGGMGGSILGGLATGAAVGAGMVAGEALARNLMGESNATAADRSPDISADNSFDPNSNMGGEDFGLGDSSSWDSSSSDFGDVGGDWS